MYIEFSLRRVMKSIFLTIATVVAAGIVGTAAVVSIVGVAHATAPPADRNNQFGSCHQSTNGKSHLLGITGQAQNDERAGCDRFKH